MRISFIIFFALFSITRSLAGYNDSARVVTLDVSGKYNIIRKLHSYTEGSAAVSPQLAYRYYQAGKFRPVVKTSNEYINDGLVYKLSWFAFEINNATPNELSVVLEYILSGVNSIECFTLNDEQKIVPLIRSKNNNIMSSDGLLAKSVTFNIHLQVGEKILLMMHTVNKGHLLYIPTRLFDITHFREYDSNKQNFFGVFQGIFFFIIIFNLLLYLTTLDKIYLFYLFYSFFISLFVLNEVGAATYSLAYLPILNYFSGQTFLFIGFSVWLLLMLQFLNLTRNNRLLYRSTIALSIIDIFFAFLPIVATFLGWREKSTFQIFYQSSISILFAVNLLFIIVTNAVRILKGNKLAIFYALANIPVIFGAIIYYTNYYNVTNITFSWLNPVALGLSIETFLISFGFAYRYNLIGKEKQKLLVHLNEQQQELTRQIINTQELEQKRIAEDLHDELGGNLAAIKMTLQSFHLPQKQSQILMQLIDDASTNTRNIAHNLMPPEFEKTILNDVLSNYYSRLNTESNTRFHFHTSGEDHQFSKEDELVIYRTIIELTGNILKHAQATEATIQLIYYDNQLEIMTEDNGKGITRKDNDGIGLKNVQSRVTYLNGEMRIDSGPGGTTIMIQFPYKLK